MDEQSIPIHTLGETAGFITEEADHFGRQDQLTAIPEKNRAKLEPQHLEITEDLIDMEENTIDYREPSIDKEITFQPMDIENPLGSLDKVPLSSVCPWLNVEDPASCMNDVNLENIELYLECSDDVENSELCDIASSNDSHVTDQEGTSMIKSDVQLRISFPEFIDERVKGFKCCCCKMTFSLESLLRDHVNIEHINQAFVCQLCMYNTKSRKFFQNHMNTKHKHVLTNEDIKSTGLLDKPSEETVTIYLLAEHDDSSSTTPTNLSANHKKDSSRSVFSKEIGSPDIHMLMCCDKTMTAVKNISSGTIPALPQTSNMSDHIQTVFTQNLDKVKPACMKLTCDECGFVTKSQKLLKSHQSTVHNHTRVAYQCPVCEFQCLQRRTFHRHELSHVGVYEFKCSVCNKQFLSKSSYTRHIKTHSVLQEYACDLNNCGLRFKTKGGLTDHKKKIHGMKNIKQHILQEAIKTSSVNNKQQTLTARSLDTTLSLSESDSSKHFNGNVRKMIPSDKDRLDELTDACESHTNTDTVIPALLTDVCESHTNTDTVIPALLTDVCESHTNTDTVIPGSGTKGTQTDVKQKKNKTSLQERDCGIKIKNYSCSYKGCFKRFRDNFNLRNHMCVHNGSMQRTCDLCEFTCVQKSSLSHHYKKKHMGAVIAQSVALKSISR